MISIDKIYSPEERLKKLSEEQIKHTQSVLCNQLDQMSEQIIEWTKNPTKYTNIWEGFKYTFSSSLDSIRLTLQKHFTNEQIKARILTELQEVQKVGYLVNVEVNLNEFQFATVTVNMPPICK